jgi:hypothetical protein
VAVSYGLSLLVAGVVAMTPFDDTRLEKVLLI